MFASLTGCGHLSGTRGRPQYSVADLSTYGDFARTERLNGYRDYAGKVVKVAPRNGMNWEDYSMACFFNCNITEARKYEITVTMSLFAEKPSTKPVISAYKPSEKVWYTPSKINRDGPSSIGLVIHKDMDDSYEQFGGDAVPVSKDRWMDLTFTETIEFEDTGTIQIYLEGNSEYQGLIDCTLYIRDFRVSVKPIFKLLALTFDGGPSDFTEEVLDKLDEYEIHGTFFLMGMNIDALNPVYDYDLDFADRREVSDWRKEIVKRIAEEGHDAANFTYTHNYLGGGKLGSDDGIDPQVMIYNIPLLPSYSATNYPLSEADIRMEIDDTQTAIQKAVYGDSSYRNYPPVSRFFRAPYNPDPAVAKNLNNVTRSLGLPIILGTGYSGFDFHSSALTIADSIYKSVEPWEIINIKFRIADTMIDEDSNLFYAQELNTLIMDIIDILVPRMLEEEYEFVTLSYMAEKRGLPLVPGAVYSSFRPD
ncbi:MAG: polysaccharide deacetylase family protein [Treponema sp.]|nr:polysaccharide deacetylase family protein [Treponema sp.]